MRNTRFMILAAALGLSAAAHATLLAYEGFDYTEAYGTSLTGLNGGTGWTEAYPSVTSSGGNITLTNGLSFPGVSTTGKSVMRTASATLTADGRNWAATATSGTYWYSWVMTAVNTGSQVSRGTFGVLQGSGSNQNGFGIRFDGGTTSALTFKAHTPAQATGANIDFGTTGWNKTYFILGRLTVNTSGNTINDLWVYRTTDPLPTSEPVTPMSTITGATGTVIPAMYGRAFGDQAPTQFDEIRIGETFEDVLVAELPPFYFGVTTPADGAVAVVTNPVISCVIRDGSGTLDNSSVDLTLNGIPVSETINKAGDESTVSFEATGLVPLSNYTAQVTYKGTSTGFFTNSWSFKTIDRLIFGTTVPANGANGVNTNVVISCTINDGAEALDDGSVVLTLNGDTVAHSTAKVGTVSTVSYETNGLETVTAYTAQVVYSSATSGNRTNSWSFTTLDPTPPLVYEGFYYTEPNGTSVAGLDGGTGWKEAYPNPDGPHTLTNGLTFEGIASTGGAMIRTGGTLTTNGRNWGYYVDSGATYWYSFLLNAKGHEGTFNLFQKTGDNQNGTGIELRHEAGTSNTLIKATAGYAVDVRTVAYGQTHLVVGRVSGGNNEMWVYAAGEAVPTVAPTGGAIVYGGAQTDRTAALSGRTFGSSWGPVIFDEIRLGLNFEDVIGAEAVPPYELWANSVGLTNGINAKTDDPDNDGLLNYAEYALNGDPLSDADTGQFVIAADAATVDVIYSKIKDDSSVIYNLVNNNDLVYGTATTNAYISQTTGPSSSEKYDSVTNVYTAGSQDFFKMVIE